MMLPFINVMIPTFNRAAMLKQAVQSLLTQNYPQERYQIIVVDDGSTDETWTVLQELAASHSKLRALRVDHAGPYAARNEGWRNGNGDIVAFTDDDCVADRRWLEAIASALTAHPETLVLQGKTATVRELVTPLTHQIIVRRPNCNYETCNMAYRREVLAAVGGFDATVLHTADSQLGAAVSALGPILFRPEMVIIHPPRPRVFPNREQWTRLLEGLLRLYCRYPDFFRRTRGPHFLFVVVWGWALLTPVENIVKHSPSLFRDPLLYLKFLVHVVRGRLILLWMLPSFWHGHKTWVKEIGRR